MRNTTDTNDTYRITTAHLALNVACSIIVSFLAWILLGLVTSIYPVRYSSHGRRPSLQERVQFTIAPAIMMTVIQCSLMILKFQTPVGVSYEVTMTGQQEDEACYAIWKLATGCWFLALAVGLTIVGVFGIALESGRWREEMKGRADSVRKENLPPLCP
jgi:hypothetical protein